MAAWWLSRRAGRSPDTLFHPQAGRRLRVLPGLGALLLAAGLLWWLYPQGVSRLSGEFHLVAQSPLTSAQASAVPALQHAPQDLAAQPLWPASTSGLQARPLTQAALQQVAPLLGQAEARLIEIYQLIGQGQHRQALAQAQALTRDHPNFQLAQLVLGDLLSMQSRPVRLLGDVPDAKAQAASEQLAVLRDESRRRIQALTERPPAGSIPAQFLQLSAQNRHAIAIDASRSRLYLFENLRASQPNSGAARAPSLRLLADFYISVGLSGIKKTVEGDQRTPLGIYHITNNLNPNDLPDLFGVGALPINFPNPLDLKRGKTGSGIWLHGTPSDQFARAPQASDGCVVLSNPDLERVLATVRIHTTPVVIAAELHWVPAQTLLGKRAQFEATLQAWQQARSTLDLEQLKAFYSSRFSHHGRDLGRTILSTPESRQRNPARPLQQWWPALVAELQAEGPQQWDIKDLSLLHWRDRQDSMVVTFGQVPAGQTSGVTLRQYWLREGDEWKIFYEGVI
ncbi:MAG: hypothetical protein EST26_08980 [Hydrogenophaga sp.]|nr:hypothetical protein [Hydrogenophaga sp.]